MVEDKGVALFLWIVGHPPMSKQNPTKEMAL